jgi:hypothetical protein
MVLWLCSLRSLLQTWALQGKDSISPSSAALGQQCLAHSICSTSECLLVLVVEDQQLTQQHILFLTQNQAATLLGFWDHNYPERQEDHPHQVTKNQMNLMLNLLWPYTLVVEPGLWLLPWNHTLNSSLGYSRVQVYILITCYPKDYHCNTIEISRHQEASQKLLLWIQY